VICPVANIVLLSATLFEELFFVDVQKLKNCTSLVYIRGFGEKKSISEAFYV
jgi:hypothetical protein